MGAVSLSEGVSDSARDREHAASGHGGDVACRSQRWGGGGQSEVAQDPGNHRGTTSEGRQLFGISPFLVQQRFVGEPDRSAFRNGAVQRSGMCFSGGRLTDTPDIVTAIVLGADVAALEIDEPSTLGVAFNRR